MVHGKHSTYSNYGCRCEACREANKVACAKHRDEHPDYYDRYRKKNHKKKLVYRTQYRLDHLNEEKERERRERKCNPEKDRKKKHRYRARKLDAFVEDVDRQVVFDRDKGICGICKLPVDRGDFHVDHVLPLTKGGKHSYTNVQLAHSKCNLLKSDKIY